MNTEALPSLMMFFVTLLAAILASSSTNAITPPTPIITRSSSVERISHCRAQVGYGTSIHSPDRVCLVCLLQLPMTAWRAHLLLPNTHVQGVMGGNNAPVLMNTWFRLDVLPASVSGTNRTWLQVRGQYIVGDAVPGCPCTCWLATLAQHSPPKLLLMCFV